LIVLFASSVWRNVQFFPLTAAIEAAAGLGLLALPDVAVNLLLGADISRAAIPLGRVAGVALLALGLASWLARGHAASALTSAMLLYNCGVAVVLAMAGVVSGMTGVLLWPAVVLHAAMAIWSLMMSWRLGSLSI
jgi:hypothetical protein